MRFKALGVAAAAVGALVFAASPASAAPYWQAVTETGNWTCTAYQHHTVSDYVDWKVCQIVNSNNDAQVAVVVRSAAPRAVTIAGGTDSSYGSTASCYTSTLNPGFTRGCLGPTVHLTSAPTRITGYFTLNGVLNGKDLYF